MGTLLRVKTARKSRLTRHSENVQYKQILTNPFRIPLTGQFSVYENYHVSFLVKSSQDSCKYEHPYKEKSISGAMLCFASTANFPNKLSFFMDLTAR